MDSLDSSTSKILFTKRIHRPWRPALLEGASEAVEVPSQISQFSSLAIDNPNIKDSLMPSEAIELNLQQHLNEKTKERNEINQQLIARGENRISIGGFLCPSNIFSVNQEEKHEKTSTLMSELKSKEQEILLLAHDLKIAKALEQTEKLEISRQQEEQARKSAEEKALFAIQQAKLAAEQIVKTEEQLNLERKFRIEDERIRKSLEEKIQKLHWEMERKEQLIHSEIEKREETLQLGKENTRLADEKVKEALEYLSITEQKLLKEFEERRQLSELEAQEKIKKIEMNAQQKIEMSQEQAQHHEKAKLAAQNWIQKGLENVRVIEIAKKEVEEKLAAALEKAKEEQTVFDQKTADLLVQINELEIKKLSMEDAHNETIKQLEASFKTINLLKLIAANERKLRKIQQDKLMGSEIRENELKRKATEDKILELNQEIGAIELGKANSDAIVITLKEDLHKYEVVLESEKTIRLSLEAKISEFMEKINQLDQMRQDEKDQREGVERELSIIANKLQHLEQEKAQNEGKTHNIVENAKTLETELRSESYLRKEAERLKQYLEQELAQGRGKMNTMNEYIKALETELGTEKYLRKEAERLKGIEEQARKAAQEKITLAIEQANRTVLNVLGGFTPS